MSSVEFDEETTFNSSTHCPGCNQVYRVTDINSLHVPLILKCNHSCCESCIRQSLLNSRSQVIVCRKCGFRSIPKPAVDPLMKNLRDNFPVADRIVHEMRAARKPNLCDESQISFSSRLQPKTNVGMTQLSDVSSAFCVDCIHQPVPAVVMCLTCDNNVFCQHCSDSLHSKNSTKNHKVIPLADDAASNVSDFSGSFFHDAKVLEQQQILQELLHRSEVKIMTIEGSLRTLSDSCAQYKNSGLYYDKLEKDCDDYFELVFNLMTRKRNDIRENLRSAKNSWRLTSKMCNKELTSLHMNLTNTSKRLRAISCLGPGQNVNVAEHMKRIDELLHKDDSVVIVPPKEPQKNIKFTYNWVEQMEKECDFDFGTSGSVTLARGAQNTSLFPRDEMMHPNYDYSADGYDFSDIKVTPAMHRTTMVSSMESARCTSSVMSDGTENRSVSCYHSPPETLPPIPRQPSLSIHSTVASRISSASGSVASCNQNGFVDNHMSKRSMKSYSIYSSNYNSSKVQSQNEASNVVAPNAAIKKQQKPYNKKLEDIGRIVSRLDMHHNIKVSHVISPSQFYVQLNNIDGYFTLLQDEYSIARNWPIPPLSEIPKNTVCVQLGSDFERHRVRVLQHQKNAEDENRSLITVFYLDIGTQGDVPLSSLRLPKGGRKKFADLSPLALSCGLYDCYPVNGLLWKNDVIESFKNHIANKHLDLFISKRTPNKLEVDLKIHGNYASSVRQLLLDTGKATFCSESHHVVSLHFSDELTYLYDTDFRVDQNWIDVRVSHIVSPCDFYAQRVNSDAALRKLSSRMNAFYKDEGNLRAAAVLNPYVGQRIAAKYDDDKLWYRAEILKINPLARKKFVVKYVDYGNDAVVGEKSIARLGQEFFKVTVQAFKCSLRDILPLNGVWQKNAVNTFRLCVEDAVLQMVVQEIKKPDNILSVSLYKNADPNKSNPISVQKVLIQKGLARGVGELAGIKSLVKKKTEPKKDKRDAENENEGNSESVGPNTATDDRSSEVLDEEPPFDVVNDDTNDERRQAPSAKKCEVKIMSICSPNKVYVHFLEKCPSAANITSDLKIFYDDVSNNESLTVDTVVNGEKYAVFSAEDSKWYRGVVVSCSEDEDKVEVKLTDFVEKKKTVSKDDLRKLPKKFLRHIDAVIKCVLVDFEEHQEDWSSEVREEINAELAKYKDLWVEIRKRSEQFLTVVLWGRSVKCSGPLDPMVVKWTSLNEKFRKMDSNDKDDGGDSGSSSQGYVPIEEKLQVLNEGNDRLDPTKHVTEWLENTSSETSGHVDYPHLSNGNEDQDPESPGTIEAEDENMDSISVVCQKKEKEEKVEQVVEWKDPPELDIDRFIGKVTHVDWDCNLYIQIIERSHSRLELISNGLRSVYQHTTAKPDDLYWCPGEICIAYWPFDKKWYRARVKQINSADDSVEVVYVDYGTDASIPRNNLRKSVSFEEIPIQCYTLRMRSDITLTSENGKWTQPVLDFVHATIVEKTCEVFLVKEPGEDFYRVQKLIIREIGMNLFDILLSLNHVVLTKQLHVHRPKEPVMDHVTEESENEDDSSTSSSDSSVIMPIERITDEKKLLDQLNKEFDEANTPINCWNVAQEAVNSSLVVSYFDVPRDGTPLMVKVTEVLSVTEIVINIISSGSDPAIEEGYKIYQKMTEDLQQEASRFPKLYPPYAGRICCTQFADGVWYRGLVIARGARNPNNVPVFYIDYGNVSFTSVTDLHELKEEWYHIPMQSIKCIIDDINLPDSKSEIERFGEDLSNSLLNKEFTAVVKELKIDERIYSIRLLNDDGEPPYQSISKSKKS